MDVYGDPHDPAVFIFGQRTPGTQRTGDCRTQTVRDVRGRAENRSVIRAENQIPTILSELTKAPVC